jgi:hypothetical protein
MAVSTLNEQGAILMKEKNAWFSVLILAHGVCGKNEVIAVVDDSLTHMMITDRETRE